jgi:hypothetical protein
VCRARVRPLDLFRACRLPLAQLVSVRADGRMSSLGGDFSKHEVLRRYSRGRTVCRVSLFKRKDETKQESNRRSDSGPRPRPGLLHGNAVRADRRGVVEGQRSPLAKPCVMHSLTLKMRPNERSEPAHSRLLAPQRRLRRISLYKYTQGLVEPMATSTTYPRHPCISSHAG